ncbi:MAG: hypothetical protein LLG14_08880 [Nocardiaceae bacterium]|nr:hypothetical protein [Nocardiaceae bacterium]
MHAYRLHTDYTLKCQCCAVSQRFVFTSKSDVIVCGYCKPHYGGTPAKLAQQQREHAALYLNRLTQASKQRNADQVKHRAELEHLERIIAQKEAIIRQLEIELGDVHISIRKGEFNEAVMSWLIDERLTQAGKESDAALRRRESQERRVAEGTTNQGASIHQLPQH